MNALNFARSNFGTDNVQFYYNLNNDSNDLAYYSGELIFSDEALANSTVDYVTHAAINVDQQIRDSG